MSIIGKIAFTVAGVAVLSAPVYSSPYVATKSEFKSNEDGYSKTVNQARVGYATTLNNGIKPYIEAGRGISTDDGVNLFDGDGFTIAEIGADIPITDRLEVKAMYEYEWGQNDARDSKLEVETKYKF